MMMFDDEEKDRETIKQLKKKKPSFSQLINKKNIDNFELDRALQEEI